MHGFHFHTIATDVPSRAVLNDCRGESISALILFKRIRETISDHLESEATWKREDV